MVIILSIFMATLAALSPVVQAKLAKPCTPGLHYCGSTLTSYGFSTASDLIPEALYSCQDNGDVTLLHECDGVPCVDGTAGLNDYCFG
ncbi:hypothetical protein E4U13_004514 [Claviceps humidiphila]|uniref:Uncharacterized protein n=1 Tax=Claviceps humidiphila TaxID=1294629 RepID=A0A9P7TP29_9HYPO|nr:hypothetical protein E4U13_004514 [Claviceps humidiphila]